MGHGAVRFKRCCAATGAAWVWLALASLSGAQTPTVKSDATWRTTATQPPDGWNTDIHFDDSDAAGWQNAFKSPSGDNIWYGSNHSDQSPNQAWFRYVFTLNQPIGNATGTFFFDDNGEAYINGRLIVADTTPGATTFLPTLDPTIFNVGSNLVAVHGIDTIPPFSNVAVDLFLLMPGDANGDGAVNFNDLLTLAQHYGQTGRGWSDGDFTGEGTVVFADLLLLAQHYGQSLVAAPADAFVNASPQIVPEPSPALLALPLLLLGTNRRRHA